MANTPTWRTALARELKKHNDNWFHILGSPGAKDEDLDKPITERISFTVWTAERIYFPTSSGDDPVTVTTGVKSVPRNPCDERTSP